MLYGSQGAWYPALSLHLKSLGVSARAAGWIFATLPLAAIASPLILGRLADRRVAAERLLAITYVIGAAILILASAYPGRDALTLTLIFLAYWLFVAPGYSISNTIAMRHLADPRREFAGIRLWGSIGWMTGSYFVAAFLFLRSRSSGGGGIHLIFYLGAILMLIAAFLSARLPQSPPMESRGLGFLRVLRSELLQDRNFRTYLLVGIGVGLTTPFVFQLIPALLESKGLSRPRVLSAMTLAQIPEVMAMFILPAVIKRLGYRGSLILGVFCWMLRYGVIAAGASLFWIIATIPLQGLAIGFFTIGGQVYVDEKAPRASRASVQALQVMCTSGIGCFLGSLLAGESQALWPNRPDFVFLVPCLIDLGLCLVLLLGFHPSGLERPNDLAVAPSAR
jgi:MFS family permease